MSTAEACGPLFAALFAGSWDCRVHLGDPRVDWPVKEECIFLWLQGFHALSTGLGKAHDVTRKQNGLGQFGLSL